MGETRSAARLGIAVVTALVAAACGSGGQRVPAPATADRPSPGGPVTRGCDSRYAENFDPGMESRTVTAGPVSLVTFRVSPIPTGDPPVRMFKLAVRLAAGSEATLRTATAGTALAYDRASFRDDNAYRLADGDARVRFVGCPDRSAVFNGAVLTTGPRTVDLVVVAAGRETPVRVTAYAS